MADLRNWLIKPAKRTADDRETPENPPPSIRRKVADGASRSVSPPRRHGLQSGSRSSQGPAIRPNFTPTPSASTQRPAPQLSPAIETNFGYSSTKSARQAARQSSPQPSPATTTNFTYPSTQRYTPQSSPATTTNFAYLSTQRSAPQSSPATRPNFTPTTPANPYPPRAPAVPPYGREPPLRIWAFGRVIYPSSPNDGRSDNNPIVIPDGDEDEDEDDDDDNSSDGVPETLEDVHGNKDEHGYRSGLPQLPRVQEVSVWDLTLEDVRPPLHPEQAAIVRLAIAGKNLFYTGPAGCGKSYVLQRIRAELLRRGKKVAVVAPTGIAAHNVGGTTYHSFLRLTPEGLNGKKKKSEVLARYRQISGDPDDPEDFEMSKNSPAADLAEPNVLIIDEISMVSSQTLDRINDILKVARQSQQPFGGLQVIATGDFYQLPPIKPFEFCCETELIPYPGSWNPVGYRCTPCAAHYLDENKWAFRSAAWKEGKFRLCRLETIHRQKDDEFLRVLNKIRAGEPLLTADQNLLMNHPCEVKDAIQLMSTNKEVNEANRRGMDLLRGPEHVYTCYDNFKETEGHEGKYDEYKETTQYREDGISVMIRVKLKDHRYAAILRFKTGARVILLSNLDRDRGLCNGTQGTITGFEPYNEKNLPSKDNGKLSAIYGSHKAGHIREFCKAQSKHQSFLPFFPIVRFDHGVTVTIYPECTIQEIGTGVRVAGSKESRYSLLCRTQLPLAAAWAITIHKSQGMTLAKAIIHLNRIQKGQMLYVALSRVQGLNGLKIVGPASKLNQSIARCLAVEEFCGTLRPAGELARRHLGDVGNGGTPGGEGEDSEDSEEDSEEDFDEDYPEDFDQELGEDSEDYDQQMMMEYERGCC